MLLALVLPPVAVWLRRGATRTAWALWALSLAAVLTLRFLAAGPGILLWALAVLAALGLVLRAAPPALQLAAPWRSVVAVFGTAALVLPLSVLPPGRTPSASSPADLALVARGNHLAEACRPCHALSSDENRVGPSLLGVIGRKAGTMPGFAYSEGLASADFVWEPELIASFATDPLTMIPGTKMAVSPRPDDETAAIVAYLLSLAQK
ncbi:c-type cytochrome [Frigidibacter sp. MR17.14]|uniref:c-type cytochrome n=1 Tax=Frigidibacter sp. MR17.14 TaxID=3126509 RepID=UPI003012C848